jgi:DNA-binding MarR family transcriptional regulator
MTNNLLKLENIYEEFRCVDTDFPLTAMIIFNIVGRGHEKFEKTNCISDLACNQDFVKILNISSASVSRNVDVLSEGSRGKVRRQNPFRLIQRERNPYDLKKNILTLTKKGAVLFNRIKNIFAENHTPYDLNYYPSKNYDKRTGFNARTGQRVTKKSKLLNQIKKLEKQLQEMA